MNCNLQSQLIFLSSVKCKRARGYDDDIYIERERMYDQKVEGTFGENPFCYKVHRDPWLAS